MGFFDWLFKLFFGTKSESTEKEAVQFSAFDSWIEKHSQSSSKQLLDESLPKFAEIKHLLKDTRSALAELREKNVDESSEGNKRLRKIVGTSQKTFADRMNQLLEKLSPPTVLDFDSVRNYCLNAWPNLEREINSFGKSIAYTSIVLKEEVSGIGSNIKELQSALKKLHNDFAENLVVKHSAETRSASLRLSEKLSEKYSLADLLKEAHAELNKLQKKASGIEQELAELSKSAEFNAVLELEKAKESALKKKDALRSELIDLLAPIDKPLRRFEALAASGSFLLEKSEKEFLDLFLRDPLLAIKQDLRADVLKKLLKELKQAIDAEKVLVKDEKDREKRLHSIESLGSFDFFGNFFWKSNQIEVELQKIEKELLQNSTTHKKASLEREFDSLQKELNEKKKATEAAAKKQAALETEIASLKELLEQLAEKLSGKKMEIKLE